MWRIPSPLFASAGGSFVDTLTTDQLIGDLFTYLGNPAGVVNVDWTIDGADLGNIIITNSFAAGSTFSFTCINGGRILGLGGDGGKGGDDQGGSGTAGSPGQNGGSALTVTGFTVDVDIDDGYLLGGGGGGGGGAYENQTTSTGNAGGGGGGGQGFIGGSGGAGGASIGLLPAADGGDGSRSAAGTGGFQGGLDNPNSGGIGGKWGSGGQTGITHDLIRTAILGINNVRGGVGGRAGRAFEPISGATLNLTGVKNEATLRSERRILGLTDAIIPAYNSSLGIEVVNISTSAVENVGFTYANNGQLNKGSLTSPTVSSVRWLTGVSTTEAAKYQFRDRANAGLITAGEDRAGSWVATLGNSFFGPPATHYITPPAFTPQSAASLVEIRRNDVPGNPTDEIICQFFVSVVDEGGV